MRGKVIFLGGLGVVAGLAIVAWRATATPTARDTAQAAAPRSVGTPARASAPTTPRRPELATPVIPAPAAPAELAPDPALAGIEAPPDVLAAFKRGESTLRTAARRCRRDLSPAPAGAAVRFAVDVVVTGGRALSSKVEVLDRGGQNAAFDACLVNELADEHWGAEIPDGKVTFEYTMELAELARG